MKLGLKIAFLLLGIIVGKGLLAQSNSSYRQLIEEADLYLKVGDIGFARIDYDKAVKMNPSDEYPRLKLAEIDRKEVTQHRIDSLFEQSLVNAEKYFKSRNFNLAQIEYNRALELKPESVFIKGRLTTIVNAASNLENSSSKPEPTKPENSLANLKTESDKHEITTTSPKVATQNNEKPIDKPTSESPAPVINQPISKSEAPKTAPVSLPATPTPFQTALTQAEEFFIVKDYENAVQRYQTAISLKPGDKGVKAKLTTARALLDKQKKDQKTYSDLILAAEKATTQKSTKQALTYYEQAALLKPDDAILQNKLITLRDRLIVEQNQDKDFADIITKADKYLHDNNLTEAKKSYELARTIKPEEKYPQEKLLEISHIEAIAESEKVKKYKETIVLAESLLNQEDFQGAFQAFSKASELQPQEGYPKQKLNELNIKIKELEAQYKIAYNGYISDANKAYQAKNWDIAMDNYQKALKAKATDTLASNQINRIIKYLDNKLILTLTPPSPSTLGGKEIKLPFKSIETAKKRNQYLIVRVKNSAAGIPRLYIGYGQDAQKNGAIIYRNLIKGANYIDYLVRIVNQDRWYRLDNNWLSLTVEGGTLEFENVKICADF